MPRNPRRATCWLRVTMLLVAGLLCLPYAASPAAAQDLAGSPLAIGVPAQITYGTGQDVLLRASPGYDQTVVNGYAEGTPVEIVEGPLTAADGSTWFGVLVAGEPGYLAADVLTTGAAPQPATDVAEAPAAAPADGAQELELTVAQPAAAPETGPAGTAYATADLNLRAGPGPDDAVLLVIPAGAPLSTTGEAANGYLGVAYDGQSGWADGAYLGAGAPAADPGLQELTVAQPAPAETTAEIPAETAAPVADPAAPAGTSASVNGLVNLRGGPSEADAVLRVLPAGSPVTVTGAESGGFVPVWYNGTAGWIATQFIDGSGLTTPSPAPPAAAPAATGETATLTGARIVAEPVNLRAEPAVASQVIGVIPGGTELTPLAGPEAGFYQVSYNGLTGWVSGAFLGQTGLPADGAQPTSAYAPGPGLEPSAGGSGLIWPVAGGSWSIMQGYNGSSHQNQSSNWQYYYSLDLVRSDGNTAGQPVLAPTAGTVRWLDPSTGGISIDIGNGHAVAMFHISVDPGLRDGTPVRQGQVIGHISGPGEAGFAGTPHVHFALWQTSDGGNWSRSAVPFTGPYAIAGQEFPDTGGSNQHRGTEIQV